MSEVGTWVSSMIMTQEVVDVDCGSVYLLCRDRRCYRSWFLVSIIYLFIFNQIW